MYRLGRPTVTKRPKKFYLFEIAVILTVVAGVLFAIFWFVIRQDKSAAISNNDKPLISRVNAAETYTEINEKTFSMRLPGTWEETERNQEAHFNSIKWDYRAKGGIGRWVKIYIDTIPSDYSVTYIVPVSSDGDSISAGGLSDHCSQFTAGAAKPTSLDKKTLGASDKMPTSWEGVRFMCDGAHPLYQRVGISSQDAINSVTVTGPTQGRHKYFLIYDDAYYNPDYTLFSTILDSFRAK